MSSIKINWNSFVSSADEYSISYRFEHLCRQLFSREFVSAGVILHCNSNNPGTEAEPIFDDKQGKYLSFQCKYFENKVDYKQIKKSAEQAIKHYQGKLDYLYLFCNKSITSTCKSFKDIESSLSKAGITLVLVTNESILDLVRKHKVLACHYFGQHEITLDWFKERAEEARMNLGGRYNPSFNVDTEASKNLSLFLQDQDAVAYFNEKKSNLKKEIKDSRWELYGWHSKAQELSDFIDTIPDVSCSNFLDVVDWQEKINSRFSKDISLICSEKKRILDKSEEIGEEHRNNSCFDEIEKLNKLLELFNGLAISDDEKKILISKILIVEGEAGVGKTQLFANEASSLLNQNEYALIILGQRYLSDHNIIKQIEDDWNKKVSFENLVNILEQEGELRGRIAPILIDALNETWVLSLWKNALPYLYNLISKQKYVRLAISFRSEYEKRIIPEDFMKMDGVFRIHHVGFRENPAEALKAFLHHYNIPFIPLQILSSGMDNPLFLTLYCKTYNRKENGENINLNDLYDRLLEKANEKIHASQKSYLKNKGYINYEDIVDPIVDCLSKKILYTKRRVVAKKEVFDLSVWKNLGLDAQPMINGLVGEGILHISLIDDEEYIYFAFDQMNDFYLAKAIMSIFASQEEVRKYIVDEVLEIKEGIVSNYNNEGIFTCVCALYAEKYHAECIDLINQIKDEYTKKQLYTSFLKSVEWRDNVYLSLEDIIDSCDKYRLRKEDVIDAFIANSVKTKHVLNADSLHKVLSWYSLSHRDYLWTTTINSMTMEDRVLQLIDLFNKGESFSLSNKEHVRLLLILFSWMLSSSCRWIRDITSTAMIEILKEHLNLTKPLLELFEGVNDPYIIQRLYGIAFGACTKREEQQKESFKDLVLYVYKTIFCKEFVYPDILLRDYARLIIDYFVTEYPDENLNVNLTRIYPPYKSEPIPGCINKDYAREKYSDGLLLIQQSMMFYGMEEMPGDFGWYIFQRAIQYFDVDNTLIYNYAMDFIINELGYKGEFFDKYDVEKGKFSLPWSPQGRIERIGKKYQWIAMYNILARVSDRFPMIKGSFGIDLYNDPSVLNVRGFDPTLNENYIENTNAPFFPQVEKHIQEAVYENEKTQSNPNVDYTEWLRSKSILFDLQKEDLMLSDQKGKQWIVLYNSVDTCEVGQDSKLTVLNWFNGFLFQKSSY